MDDLATRILTALEQAAISGLCRDGQIEIGAQEARRLRPDLDDDELLELAEMAYRQLTER